MALRHHSTMATTSRFPRGSVLSVDAGPVSELVKVTHCAGVGPFTLTVRRYRWFDRLRDTVRARWRRAWRWATKPVRDWRYDRCDTPRCLRTAVLETDDYDGYCAKHAPAGAHPLEGDE